MSSAPSSPIPSTENLHKSHFVHLRMSSEYSLVEGILRMERALMLAEKYHMPALSLTDIGNMFGAIKFSKAALCKSKAAEKSKDRQHIIQPIIGAQLWVRSRWMSKRMRIIALVQNAIGYQRLCNLLTTSYITVSHADQAVIDLHTLTRKDFEGLFILSGHLEGDIGELLLANQFKKASQLAAHWQDLTNGQYLLELQWAQRLGERAINEGSLVIADQHHIPVVATHPILFEREEDYEAHEARVCIANDEILTNPERERRYSCKQYFTSPEEMYKLFVDYPQAIENTLTVARSCHFIFDFLTADKPVYHMPSIEVPQAFSATSERPVTVDDWIDTLAHQELEVWLKKIFPENDAYQQNNPIYRERLKFELNVIKNMGFSSYYLVVAEFINWAREHYIPVGPGRGSGAGSLVAFVLHITDIDPIKHGLLFERFLNPARISMPDFDIDFCEDKRSLVIKHVRERYGNEHVAQIITFMSMGARGAIRDCGRVLGATVGVCSALADLIPNVIDITLEKAKEDEPEIRKKLEQEQVFADIWDLALKLEGLPRNAGVHAAGIVITPKNINHYCPLYRTNEESTPACQYNMKDLEDLGLVKFDFLGLATLTIINNAVSHVKRLTHNPNFRVDQLPWFDEEAYQIFQRGDTNAIFQSESRVAKDLARKIHIENFEEITALMALNRPGPLNSGVTEIFINVKHKKQPMEIPDERLRDILESTYGVIIYQEQVMKIAQILAKYSLGEADNLRRAMGKKDAESMQKEKNKFIEGARANNTEYSVAQKLYDTIEKFADYGFNKSHAAAYALLSYQEAYLKAHHFSAFMAAVLTNEIARSHTKIAEFIRECRLRGIIMTPPSINEGEYAFIPQDEKTIIFGLGAIKGIGLTAITSIVEARKQQGAFRDFDDWIARIDRTVVNRKALEVLIKAGAIDTLSESTDRQYYLKQLEHLSESQSYGQADLFADIAPQQNHAPNASKKPLNKEHSTVIRHKRKNLMMEKEVFEFYLSGHMIDFYRRDFQNLHLKSIHALAMSLVGAESGKTRLIWAAGMIVYTRIRKTKKGKLMMTVFLDDNSNTYLDLVVYSKLLETKRPLLKEGSVILVYGVIKAEEKQTTDNALDEGSTESNHMLRMQAEDIMSYSQLLQRAQSIQLSLNDLDALPPFEQFLQQCHTGKVNIYIEVTSHTPIPPEMLPTTTEITKSSPSPKPIIAKAIVQLGTKHCIQLTENALMFLREQYGENAINVYFPPLPTPYIKPKSAWKSKKTQPTH